MGFRLGFGGGCAPCCGTAIDDGCLSSCRPSGETRPIASVNVTLQASAYNVEVSYLDRNDGVLKPFTYRFPGASYAGTFALTPVDANEFRYTFPSRYGCTPSLHFYRQARVQGILRTCVLQANLYSGVAFGKAFTNADAVGVIDGQSSDTIYGVACGTQATKAFEAGKCAGKFATGFGWYFDGTHSVVDAINTVYTNPAPNSSVVVFDPCVRPTPDYLGYGWPTLQAMAYPDIGTLAVTGDPKVIVTNVSTSYA